MKGDIIIFKNEVCENKELYDWMITLDVRIRKPVNIETTLLDDEKPWKCCVSKSKEWNKSAYSKIQVLH